MIGYSWEQAMANKQQKNLPILFSALPRSILKPIKVKALDTRCRGGRTWCKEAFWGHMKWWIHRKSWRQAPPIIPFPFSGKIFCAWTFTFNYQDSFFDRTAQRVGARIVACVCLYQPQIIVAGVPEPMSAPLWINAQRQRQSLIRLPLRLLYLAHISLSFSAAPLLFRNPLCKTFRSRDSRQRKEGGGTFFRAFCIIKLFLWKETSVVDMKMPKVSAFKITKITELVERRRQSMQRLQFQRWVSSGALYWTCRDRLPHRLSHSRHPCHTPQKNCGKKQHRRQLTSQTSGKRKWHCHPAEETVRT